MGIKAVTPVCFNSVTEYVCEVTGSTSLTWIAGHNYIYTAAFLSTNSLNSSIFRGENGEYEFKFTDLERSSNISQISDFRSTAYIYVTIAVNGTFLKCTDGVSSTAIRILLNNSEYFIFNTFSLSHFHSKE